MEERMDGQKIKEEVKKRYTAALLTQKSCCGSGPEIIPADRVVKFAGYENQDLRNIPIEAVSSSFGCGNPLAFSEVLPGQTVVDIGSGAGLDCFIAAEKVGPLGRVIGIDMTQAMIDKATSNARKNGFANVDFRLAEAENMPLQDASADWIISNCVINLSPDKPSVFREAFRVLKKGGRLSVSDIMVNDLPKPLRWSSALYAACVSGAIAEDEYVKGLMQAGFDNVRVTERFVYETPQIVGMLRDSRFLKLSSVLSDKMMERLLDRYVSGKIWSARIIAEKK